MGHVGKYTIHGYHGIGIFRGLVLRACKCFPIVDAVSRNGGALQRHLAKSHLWQISSPCAISLPFGTKPVSQKAMVTRSICDYTSLEAGVVTFCDDCTKPVLSWRFSKSWELVQEQMPYKQAVLIFNHVPPPPEM